MDHIDCIVIGAGVVGLAIAREMALAGRDVIIVEEQGEFGSGTSSRNSEVIHAGIYYEPGSLKARLSVAGRALLYAYCEEHQLAHRRCGKLIVASEPQQAEFLDRLRQRAALNGVADLKMLSGPEAIEMEPELQCVAALYSPSSGIIDSHAFMRQLLADAESAGAVIAYRTKVVAADATGSEITLELSTYNGEHARLSADCVVNAAGLSATELAKTFKGIPLDSIPDTYFAKGNYFSLQGRSPFSRLIYPIPVPGGLGIHLTLDLAGQTRFGPDVEWLEAKSVAELDYKVNPARGNDFYESIRQYWPGLKDGALMPAYSGVRPKIAARGTEADFAVQYLGQGKGRGIVNLFGIESPGLTGSLAIAQHVSQLFDKP